MKMNVKHPLGSHNSKQSFSSNKSCSFFFEKKNWENIGNFGLYSVNWTDFSLFFWGLKIRQIFYINFFKNIKSLGLTKDKATTSNNKCSS
jgi:hypothetical protein